MTAEVKYQNKITTLLLPQKLSELRHDVWRSSSFVDALIDSDDIRLHLSILKLYYPWMVKVLLPSRISELLHHWRLDYDFKDMHIAPAHALLWIKWQAPPTDFRTGTLREFIYMDEYLADNDILHLTALFYRPRVDTDEAVARDDYRSRLVSRDQVERYAHTLQRHMSDGVRRMMAASLIYAYATKQLIYDLYGSRLFEGGGETPPRHNLGWTATALQVAEQGVFGSYEQVLDTTMHEVLAYLLIKKSEADAMEAARNNKS